MFVNFTLPVLGTVGVLISKVQYGITTVGYWGDEHLFEKPWFSDWAMFVGMFACFPVYWTTRCYRKGLPNLFSLSICWMPSAKGIPEVPPQSKHTWLLVIVPGLCDMVSTFMVCHCLCFIILAFPSNSFR